MSRINLERRVVCAANRNKNGDMILGARHWDGVMQQAYRIYMNQLDFDEKEVKDLTDFKEQGFINTWGEFLTRNQAWKVAEHNNQIINRVGGDTSDKGVGKLFSENLY